MLMSKDLFEAMLMVKSKVVFEPEIERVVRPTIVLKSNIIGLLVDN